VAIATGMCYSDDTIGLCAAGAAAVNGIILTGPLLESHIKNRHVSPSGREKAK